MTEQLSIDFARAVGERQARRAADRAERKEPGFTDFAMRCVLAHLEAHGPSTGEDCTDACKRHGITPLDDRAFGVVYSMLARRGKIRCAGTAPRRKGHGTAGARLWALVDH